MSIPSLFFSVLFTKKKKKNKQKKTKQKKQAFRAKQMGPWHRVSSGAVPVLLSFFFISLFFFARCVRERYLLLIFLLFFLRQFVDNDRQKNMPKKQIIKTRSINGCLKRKEGGVHGTPLDDYCLL